MSKSSSQGIWFGPYNGFMETTIFSLLKSIKKGVIVNIKIDIFDLNGKKLIEFVVNEVKGNLPFYFNIPRNKKIKNIKGSVGVSIISGKNLIPDTWMMILKQDNELIGLINSATAPNLNQINNKQKRYRMLSGAINLSQDVISESYHINRSINKKYDKIAEFEISVYDTSGEIISKYFEYVKPNGTGIVNINELLIKDKNFNKNIGFYTVISHNVSAIGYHMILNKNNNQMACDHTRPLVTYLNMSYGQENFKFKHNYFNNIIDIFRKVKFYLKNV